MPQALATTGAVYQGLALPSDGKVPTLSEHLKANEPRVSTSAGLGAVSEDGSGTWAITVPTLPALLAPQVTLRWSSQGEPVGWVAPGWTLDVGGFLSELEPAAASGAFAYVSDDVVRVSGFGIDGLLVEVGETQSVQLLPGAEGFPWELEGERYELRGYDSGFAVGWYVESRNTWVVRSGTVSYVFLPAGQSWDWSTVGAGNTAGAAATRWVPVLAFDTSGNWVGWSYGSSGRPLAIAYGGAATTGTLGPALARVQFEYDPVGSAPPISYRHGVRERFDMALRAIHVCSTEDNVTTSVAPCTDGAPYRSISWDTSTIDGRRVLDRVWTDGAWVEGGGPRSRRVEAEFSWHRWDGSYDEIPTEDFWGNGRALGYAAPGFDSTVTLSVSGLYTERYGLTAQRGVASTYTLSQLADFDGDGLDDVGATRVEDESTCDEGAAESYFEYATQDAGGALRTLFEVGSEPRLFWDECIRNSEASEPRRLGRGAIGASFTADLAPHVVAVFQRRVSVDFNGDGYLDLVEGVAPAASAPMLEPMQDAPEFMTPTLLGMWQARALGAAGSAMSAGYPGWRDAAGPSGSWVPGAASGFRWEIRLGGPDGYTSDPMLFRAPFPYPEVRVVNSFCSPEDEVAELDLPSTLGPSHWNALHRNTIEGAVNGAPVVQLLDINGDRRLDVVYNPSMDWVQGGVRAHFPVAAEDCYFPPEPTPGPGPNQPALTDSLCAFAQSGDGAPSGQVPSDVMWFPQHAFERERHLGLLELSTTEFGDLALDSRRALFESATLLADGNSDVGDQLLSRRWTVAHVEEAWLVSWELAREASDSDAPDPAGSCATAFVDEVRSLLDLNGDGFPDLVVADGSGDAWTVFPGTGAGFGAPIEDWTALAPNDGFETPWGSAPVTRTMEGFTTAVPWRMPDGLSTTFELRIPASGDIHLFSFPGFPAGRPTLGDTDSDTDDSDGANGGDQGDGGDTDGGATSGYVSGEVFLDGAPASPPEPAVLNLLVESLVTSTGEDPEMYAHEALTRGEEWQTVGLVDMDGDGLLDRVFALREDPVREIADAAFDWYRNTGGGFAGASDGTGGMCGERQDLGDGQCPEAIRFTHGIVRSQSWSALSMTWERVTGRSMLANVTDLNGDRLPDFIGLTEGDGEGPSVAIAHAKLPRTGALRRVSSPGGLSSMYTWVPGATIHPAGDDTKQKLGRIGHDVVDTVTSFDAVTRHATRAVHYYGRPVCGGGVCPGLVDRMVSVYEAESTGFVSGVFRLAPGADDLLESGLPGNPLGGGGGGPSFRDTGSEFGTGLAMQDWRFLHATRTKNDVDRDAVVPIRTWVWTDIDHDGVPTFGSSGERIVYQVDIRRWACDPSVDPSDESGCDSFAFAPDGPDGGDFGRSSCAGPVEDLAFATQFDVAKFAPAVGSCRTRWIYDARRGQNAGPLQHEVRTGFAWDVDGLLVGRSRAEVDGGPAETARLLVSHAWDEARTMTAPSQVVMTGAAPGSSGEVPLSRVRYAYDGDPVFSGDIGARGLLTRQWTCGDGRGINLSGACNDPVLWDFQYTARGALNAVDGPVGSDRQVVSFGFGDAVPLAEQDALGNMTMREVDSFGRTVVTIDPNGLEAHTEYDGFDRPVAKGQCGVLPPGAPFAAPCPVWLERWEYRDDAAPLATHHMTLQAQPVVESPDPGSAIELVYQPERHDWTFRDGAGNARQHWSQRADGRFVVQDTVHDLLGQLRYTTYPRTSEASPESIDGVSALRAASGAEVLREIWYDAFGRELVSYADRTAKPACFRRTTEPNAGEIVSYDESGRARALVHDALGRLVEVREDRVALASDEGCALPTSAVPTSPVARYTYDGDGKLASLSVPSNGVSWSHWLYRHDGAGRQAEVRRQYGGTPDWGSADPYFAFVYDGGLPVEMHEGSIDSGEPEVLWEYDELGRVIAKHVVRATCPSEGPPVLPRLADVWTWTWDEEWIGALSEATSPWETTTFHHTNVDPDIIEPFGFSGKVKEMRRQFVDTWDEPTFRFVYDMQGRQSAKIFPSGTEVWTHREHGVEVRYDVHYAGYEDTEIFQLSYDDFGQLSRISGDHWWAFPELPEGSPLPEEPLVPYRAGSPVEFGYERSRPGVVDALWMSTATSELYEQQLLYGADDRLIAKDYVFDEVTAALVDVGGADIAYDAAGRVASMTVSTSPYAVDPNGTASTYVAGAYVYDVLGNLVTLDKTARSPSGTLQSAEVSYDAAGPFGHVPGRSLVEGTGSPLHALLSADEVFTSDPVTGRTVSAELVRDEGEASEHWTLRGYGYDGAGRLACGEVSYRDADEAPYVRSRRVRLGYDLSDALVSRKVTRTSGGSSTELWFDGWQLDDPWEAGGGPLRVVEHLLPFVDAVIDPYTGAAEPVYLFRERDGHVLVQLDATSLVDAVSVLDPYGAVVSRVSLDDFHDELPVPSFPTDVRTLHHFHGQEFDAELNLTRMGVRHVSMTGDGRWLQPEPLLHLGPGPEQLRDPRAMFGAYARGAPTNLQDRSGYCPDASDSAQCVPEAVQNTFGPLQRLASFLGSRSDAIADAAVVTTETVAGATTEDVSALQGAQGLLVQGWAVVSAAGSRFMDGIGSFVTRARAVEAARDASKAVRTAVHPDVANGNKIAHVFQEKHGLGGLVEKLGGQEEAMGAIVKAAEGRVLESGQTSGAYSAIVEVAGETLEVRGAVVDDVVRVSTAFKVTE